MEGGCPPCYFARAMMFQNFGSIYTVSSVMLAKKGPRKCKHVQTLPTPWSPPNLDAYASIPHVERPRPSGSGKPCMSVTNKLASLPVGYLSSRSSCGHRFNIQTAKFLSLLPSITGDNP